MGAYGPCTHRFVGEPVSPGFGLDLQDVEREMTPEEFEGNVVLGVLDGGTPPGDWLEEIAAGNVLVLAIEGDLNDLATGFAGEVKEGGGNLVHFRDFLIVSPPSVTVDTGRLNR